MKLDEIYASHPLRAETILARLHRDGRDLADLNEWQLAVDPISEITDQNHSGGVQAVLELAALARITSSSVVVDVGAGLGGSARVLAATFGCVVLGIERDAGRYRDAVELTSRVRLQHLATFQLADALEGPVAVQDVDVLWGQGAWVHFPSPEDFLVRWRPILRPGGRIAMADAFLLRQPSAPNEVALVREVEDLWGAHLRSMNDWKASMRHAGFTHLNAYDVTARAAADVARLESVASAWPGGTVMDAETRGWSRAREAFARGLVGSFQLIGETSV